LRSGRGEADPVPESGAATAPNRKSVKWNRRRRRRRPHHRAHSPTTVVHAPNADFGATTKMRVFGRLVSRCRARVTVVLPAPGTEKFAPCDRLNSRDRSRTWKGLRVRFVKPKDVRRAAISSFGNREISPFWAESACFRSSENFLIRSAACLSGLN
jgi:hypothetical protein